MTTQESSPAEIQAIYTQRDARRPPDWRHLRAQRLIDQGATPDDQWDDEATHLAFAAIGRSHEQDDEVKEVMQIAADDDCDKWELEASILAHRSIRDAAAQVGRSHKVVALYESIFFCVLDRIEFPRYIVDSVIRHREFYEPTDVRAIWLKVGFTMGPVMLTAWIDDFKSRGLADYTDIVTAARSKPNDGIGQVIDLLVRLFCLPPNTAAGSHYVATMAGVLGGHIQGEHPQQEAATNNEELIGQLANTVDDVLADLPSRALEEYRARAS